MPNEYIQPPNMPPGYAQSGTNGAGQSTLVVPLLVAPKANTGFTSVAMVANRWFSVRRSTATQSDSITYDVNLEAGTYTMQLYCETATNAAQATVTIGGASLTSLGGSADFFECYAAAGNSTEILSITGIAIAAAGRKTVVISNPTKHASSSAYQLLLAGFGFVRTGN